MMLEIAKFWSSKCTFNQKIGRYEILGVMGPDEFHEKYPGASDAGINNNAFTNVMVAWLLNTAVVMLENLPSVRRHELKSLLSICNSELRRWKDITKKMTVKWKDSIISQFEGYHDLKELDLEAYRSKYGSVLRLDRILKAEGDSPDAYKISKQPDVCQLFYHLTFDELQATLERMGYKITKEMVLENIRYYFQRTTHGSSISLPVFSQILYSFDTEQAWRLYKEGVLNDVCDTQQGTTQEGIHVVPMACSINMLFFQLCGIDTTKGALKFNPKLPKEVNSLDVRVLYRGKWLEVHLTQSSLWISEHEGPNRVPVIFREETYELVPGQILKFNL